MLKNNSVVLLFFLFINSLCIAQKQSSAKLNHGNYKWASGLNIGHAFIKGDVPENKMQLNAGLHLYKPFAKWFGLKFKYNYGNAKGMHWLYSENYAKNPAWSSNYAAPTRTSNGVIVYGYNNNGVFTPTTKQDYVYYNYKSSIHNLSLSAQFTLPLPFEKPRVGIYLFLGSGLTFFNTKVNALNGNSSYATLFNSIANSTHQNKKEVLSKLKTGMDNTYETSAERRDNEPIFSKHFGLGFSYKFNNRFEIGIERTATGIKTDLLDGQRWQEHAYGDAAITRDFDFIISNHITFSYYF